MTSPCWGSSWTTQLCFPLNNFCHICALTLRFSIFFFYFLDVFCSFSETFEKIWWRIVVFLQQLFHPKLLSKICSVIYLSVYLFVYCYLKINKFRGGVAQSDHYFFSTDGLHFYNNINFKSFSKISESCAEAGCITLAIKEITYDDNEEFFLWYGWPMKGVSLISIRDHCQRSSPSRISDTPRARFEPAQNRSSGFDKWSCAVVITTTPWRQPAFRKLL